MGLLDPPYVTPTQLANTVAGFPTRAQAGVVPLSYAQRPTIPTLTKRPDVSIGTLSQIGLQTIYTPWMIRVPDAIYAQYPQYGKWRCYTSTDHDSDAGGIAIGVCMSDDTVLDGTTWSWLRNGSSAVMYTGGAGTQSETPCVVWNPETNLFHLYYQDQVGTGSNLVQQTKVVTSADGVTGWSAPTVAIPTLATTIAGWGHTGYAKVFYIDGLWCAWHLQGSGSDDVAGYGWSFSYDGLTFTTDRRRFGPGIQYTDGVLRLGISSIFHWRGTVWAIGSGTDVAASGKTASTDVKVWMAPINGEDDYRSFRGKPRYIPWALTSPETAQSVPPPAYGVHPDGRLIGAYRVNGPSGFLALAVLS